MSNNSVFKYRLITAPAVEPVSLADAKLFLKVDDSADDALITSLIISARESIELYTGRMLINQTWIASNDTTPPAMLELRGGRIDSVTSIKVYDNVGTFQTVDASDYYVDNAGARIALNSGGYWPSATRVLNGFEVEFVGGYGAASTDVPNDLILAVKQLVSHSYEYREPIILSDSTNVMPEGMFEVMQKYSIIKI